MNAMIAIVSAILSAIIAAIVSWAICARTLREHQRSQLHDLVTMVIGIGIEYPYLEDDNFCASWKEMDKTTERAMRYDNYCCLVFNLMERLWQFSEGKEE